MQTACAVLPGGTAAGRAMDHEVDPISIEDILVLRGMSDRLVDPLRCTKALVDATLAENPSSECD